MATVIDELVVKLGLDPANFDDGERRLADSLRRMESVAQSGGRRVQESVGQGAVQFFRMIESPFGALRKQFENLAQYTDAPRQQLRTLEDQGRRTGESVEGGALAGARGLRVLGAAGLGVFAAYEALSKTISSANEGAQRLFGAGIGAAAAGLPIQEFTAISQALFHGGNVPQEQTQATLGSWRGAQLGYNRGDPASIQQLTEFNTSLARLGIANVDVWHDSPEQIMNKLAADFAAMPADQALSAGQSLGLTPLQVNGMRKVGANLPAATEEERQRAATEGQSKAATDLVEATNNLNIAWDNLTRKFNEFIDGPIAKLENALAAILGFLGGDKSPTDAGLDIWGALGVGPHAKPSDAPADTRNWWQRVAPTWAGGKPAPVAPAGGGGTGSTSWVPPSSNTDMGAIASTVAAAGGNQQTQAAFMAMFTPEDPGLNPSGTEEISGSGGVGGRGGASWAQWTASRRRQLEAFGWTGTNPATDRIASQKMLYWELTNNPQFRTMVQRMNAAPSATEAAKIGGFTYEQGGSPSSMFGYRGGETQEFMDSFHSRHAEDYLAKLQRDHAGAGDTTTNDNSRTHNGDVNVTVNAPTREGGAIADAIQDRIQRVSLATTANTGLQ